MPATVETRPVRSSPLRRLAVAGALALMASGCLSRTPLTTGSIALSGNSAELLKDDRVKALYLGGEL